jgi:uncharacterized repeat protein (TIGR01451 family)
VGKRGPGDGLTGYCFLTADTSLPGSLRDSTATGTNVSPATRTVQITVTPGPTPEVTVDMDFTGGTNFQPVLSYQLPTPLPSTFKFGLSASTGGSRDVHLIRNLTVTSLEPLPEINLVKQVAITTPPQPSAYPLGSTVPYQFVVTNTAGDTLSNVVVDDPSVSNLQCPGTTFGPAGSPTATMVCTASHVVDETDVVKPTLTNTATATGENSLSTEVSSTASATVNLASTPVLTKTAVDRVVAAGNPIGFNITYESGPTERVVRSDPHRPVARRLWGRLVHRQPVRAGDLQHHRSATRSNPGLRHLHPRRRSKPVRAGDQRYRNHDSVQRLDEHGHRHLSRCGHHDGDRSGHRRLSGLTDRDQDHQRSGGGPAGTGRHPHRMRRRDPDPGSHHPAGSDHAGDGHVRQPHARRAVHG